MFDGTKVQTIDGTRSTQATVSPGMATVCAKACGARNNITAASKIKTADFTLTFKPSFRTRPRAIQLGRRDKQKDLYHDGSIRDVDRGPYRPRPFRPHP